MEKTQIEIELLTPTYLGGANSQPEFRIPSIKGLLRFWLRAIDPNYRKWEPRVFGGVSDVASDTGAGPIMLRCAGSHRRPRTVESDQGLPGLKYLNYGPRAQRRKALAPNQRFTINCITRIPKVDDGLLDRFSFSWWALTTIGGLGARSRRGFGSSEVVDLRTDWEEMDILTSQMNCASTDEWIEEFEKAYASLEEKMTGTQTDDHFHIRRGTRFLLLGDEYDSGNGFRGWQDALDFFGRKLQSIRDSATPEQNAALGMPVKRRRYTIRAKNSKRGASPMVAKVLRLEGEYFILLTITNSPVCASGDSLSIRINKTRGVPKPDYTILDEVYDELSVRAIYGKEVK
jgi:CRISPR-associated protein Cmr1